MKRSKKCSMFATICEHESKTNESVFDKNEFEGKLTGRDKCSKKVSIAENLNCDYSDSNNSDVHDMFDDEINIIDGIMKSNIKNIYRDVIYYSVWTFYEIMQCTIIYIFFAFSLLFYYFI